MPNRTGSGGSNPPASAKLGSLAQLDRARRYERRCREFESLTSHKTGDLAELAYCTGPENRQTETSQRFESFSLRNVLLHCIMVVRQNLDLQVVVRFHLEQQRLGALADMVYAQD